MVKVELRSASEAGEILEAALKIRNPELWQKRKENVAKQKRTAKKNGKKLGTIYNTWGMAATTALTHLGLNAVNRELSESRVQHFLSDMGDGRWHFSPDPIVISEEGYILNGQHRLAAAAWISYSSSPAGRASEYSRDSDPRWGDDIPQFLVVWGVDKKTALLMDEAARSTKDRRHIALRYAEVV
jgi:hypothetical protein